MRMVPIFLMAALCLAPSSVFAQDADAVVRAALADQVIDLTVRDSLQKIMGEMIERQAATLVELTDEQRAWYADRALPILQPHLERMMDEMEAHYAERFTEAELRSLVVFYDTPEGRLIAEKQVEVGAFVGEQTMAMTEAYVADLLQKFCARFDCGSADDQAAGLKGN